MDRTENILKRNKGQKISNFDKNNKSIYPRKKQNAGGKKSRFITIELLKTRDKEKILNMTKEKSRIDIEEE